jgi:glycosyltransferase A (GT-A) superfamily protein (DUF2064 family)
VQAHVLVAAKAPVPGRVKTRLGAEIGADRAAALAAAALLDTVAVCTAVFGPGRCHLALDGDLDDAVAGREIREALAGWSVRAQHGDGLGPRLARAHADLASVRPAGPVVQIGMDTPQVSGALLAGVVALLGGHDAVLAPAVDGGWWALALRRPADAAPLAGVALSTDRAGADTRAALTAAGLDVGTGPEARDVDTVADAAAVARLAPGSRFARAWEALGVR